MLHNVGQSNLKLCSSSSSKSVASTRKCHNLRQSAESKWSIASKIKANNNFAVVVVVVMRIANFGAIRKR